MITLDVEEYCQECPEFEAEVESIKYPDYMGGHRIGFCDTVIRCEHRDKCHQLYKHIKKNEENENDV